MATASGVSTRGAPRFAWTGDLPQRARLVVGLVHRVCGTPAVSVPQTRTQATQGLDPKATSGGDATSLVATQVSRDSEVHDANTSHIDATIAVAARIDSASAFHDWLQLINTRRQHAADASFRTQLNVLLFLRDWIALQGSRLDAVAAVLNDLQRDYDTVQHRTQVLNDACNRILAEKRAAQDVVLELGTRLDHFNVLEPTVQLFSLSGDNVCLDPRFLPALAQLYKSIQFIETHRSYHGADMYLMRFRQCLTRGLTLISMHVANSFRASVATISAEIVQTLAAPSTTQQRQQEKDSNQQQVPHLTASQQMTFFYVKFAALNIEIRPLIRELETRCETAPENLTLYNDCVEAYFNLRRQLLGNYIIDHIRNISEFGDMLVTCRGGLTYVMRLSADEVALYRQFFKQDSPLLTEYVSYLSSFLYSTLRPLILKEQNIDKLAELCHTLRIYLETNDNAVARMAYQQQNTPQQQSLIRPRALSTGQQQSTLAVTTIMSSAASTVDVEASRRLQDQAQLSMIARRILEDTQQRLSFRVQGYIDSEIKSVWLKVPELNVFVSMYKEKRDVLLKDSRNNVENVGGITNNTAEGEAQPTSPTTSMTILVDENDFYGGGSWYPAVYKTVTSLEKIYGCLPDAVFEDLAKLAIQNCMQSLDYAVSLIASSAGQEDATLFRQCNETFMKRRLSPLNVSLPQRT